MQPRTVTLLLEDLEFVLFVPAELSLCAIAKLPMSNVLRTEATDEKTGFAKVLVSGTDDRIVGFTMIGSEAGEVLAAVQTAMLAELPYPKLRDAVIAHLTMAEALGPLLSNVPPRLKQ